MTDLYAVLGVAPDATEKEIREAYRLAARESHPDRRPGDAAAEDRFKQVNAAYEVLADAVRRADYDRDRRRRVSTGAVTIPVRHVDASRRTRRDVRIRRAGNGLAATVPITYPEAVLGANVTVPLLDGAQVTVRIPPGTPSGSTLRVRSDLAVTVEIFVPRQVSEAERRALRALADAMAGG